MNTINEEVTKKKVYVFGKHPNNDKEYQFRKAKHFKGRLAVGDKVFVKNKLGTVPLIITRIDVTEENRKGITGCVIAREKKHESKTV